VVIRYIDHFCCSRLDRGVVRIVEVGYIIDHYCCGAFCCGWSWCRSLLFKWLCAVELFLFLHHHVCTGFVDSPN